MPVFFILLILVALALWYGLSKFFAKIGEKADKTAKYFKENLKDEEEQEKKNE